MEKARAVREAALAVGLEQRQRALL